MTATRTRVPLFAVDDEWDLDQASDRISRFGAYLAQRLCEFSSFSPGSWESFCWYVATPPVMAPGYLRLAPEVADANCHWDSDSGAGLVGTVTVCARLPERLPGWSGWIRRSGGGLEEPRPGVRSALATVTFEAIVLETRDLAIESFDPLALPREELVAVAKGTVRVLARAMNAAFGEAAAAVVP